MAVLLGVVRDDDPQGMYLIAFAEEGYTIFIVLGRGDAVVAHQRVGHHEDLASVAGVRKALGVARHGGVEYNLACYGGFVAEGIPLEAAAVIED